jgi:hypothetical protein
MWIKNKKTGLVWEITSESQKNSLLRNPDFVESRKVVAEKKSKKETKED